MNQEPLPPSSPELTLVTPAYDEERNLPLLYERLCVALDGVDWEWVVVDDHSTDRTFAVVQSLAAADPRVRGIRLSRNCGSHSSVQCGIEHARGAGVVVMASDLQDPPESIPQLLVEWRAGAQVVWAVREERQGESLATRGSSRVYHWMMRHVVGMKELPSTGADFFLIDRLVVDALARFQERNGSIFTLITWLGFRQTSIFYSKAARAHGSSKWTLEKKVKLALDSVLSFSYLPIRLISYLGITVAFFGLLYASAVIYNALTGAPADGWSSLMVVVLVLGGMQMTMMGVLGEYLWRALDEARRRPLYTVEATTLLQRGGGS